MPHLGRIRTSMGWHALGPRLSDVAAFPRHLLRVLDSWRGQRRFTTTNAWSDCEQPTRGPSAASSQPCLAPCASAAAGPVTARAFARMIRRGRKWRRRGKQKKIASATTWRDRDSSNRRRRTYVPVRDAPHAAAEPCPRPKRRDSLGPSSDEPPASPGTHTDHRPSSRRPDWPSSPHHLIVSIHSSWTCSNHITAFQIGTADARGWL